MEAESVEKFQQSGCSGQESESGGQECFGCVVVWWFGGLKSPISPLFLSSPMRYEGRMMMTMMMVKSSQSLLQYFTPPLHCSTTALFHHCTAAHMLAYLVN